MDEVRKLAQTAALIAAQLTTDEVESFRWQTTGRTGVYEVQLNLKEGGRRQYTVIEWEEGDAVTPSLFP